MMGESTPMLSRGFRPRRLLWPLLLCLSSVAMILVAWSFTISPSSSSVLMDMKAIRKDIENLNTEDNPDVLRMHIKKLYKALVNTTNRIDELEKELSKCAKPAAQAGTATDKANAEGMSSKNNTDGTQPPDSVDSVEQDERYRKYLLDFNIEDASSREKWPWADDTLYYEKLGGANGFQFSKADEVIDSGKAGSYGVEEKGGER